MLKSLLLCTSTCLAFNFPVERSIIIFICIILNYNLKNMNYYNTILDNLNCNLIMLSYLVIVLCVLTNNKFRYIKKYLLCNTTLLVFLATSFFSKNILFFFYIVWVFLSSSIFSYPRLRLSTRTAPIIYLFSFLYVTRIVTLIDNYNNI